MSNIIALLIICLALTTIFGLYKALDKRGLYFAFIILNIVTFIFCFKISTIFRMNVNTSILTLIEINSIIYIFLLKYGKQEIKNLIILTFISNVMTSLLILVMNMYIPAITETISINMQGTFEYNYKILIIYPIITAISQYLISKFYQLISMIQKNIVLCIIVTYIISSMLYTVIFCVLCYINIFELKDSLFLGISTYILGIAITILNIPYIYYLFYKKVAK